jgi:hypothetical protein
MRSYFYSLLRKYLSIFILPQNLVVEIDPTSSLLVGSMSQGKLAFRDQTGDMFKDSIYDKNKILPMSSIANNKPEYIVVSGLIHYERNIQGMFSTLHKLCSNDTRIVLIYYSSLWRPLINMASKFGLRHKLPELNWLANEDINNLLELEDFEMIRLDQKILIPIYFPVISNFFNRYIAPLPIFKNFCLLNIAVARPLIFNSSFVTDNLAKIPSVSIVIPARNEAGNIANIINRIPQMGPNDEIIFVEGDSKDDTWKAIQDAQVRYGSERKIIITKQIGKGKGDAVRKGFEMATNEILMILDADITVPPEDLPKFYDAIKNNKGEFINGTRLVYPMEQEAMRFFNLLGNKFFAMAFSFVLGQRFKDTLCGTKVISRFNYLKLANNRSFFGDFDPFGDFDLIFGAARMGLKIIEVPISYKGRVYGQTNISRWRHGAILLTMLMFSARRIKFI